MPNRKSTGYVGEWFQKAQQDLRRVSELETYRELCQQVTGYYLIERYPALGPPPSVDEIRLGYQSARRFARWIRARTE